MRLRTLVIALGIATPLVAVASGPAAHAIGFGVGATATRPPATTPVAAHRAPTATMATRPAVTDTTATHPPITADTDSMAAVGAGVVGVATAGAATVSVGHALALLVEHASPAFVGASAAASVVDGNGVLSLPNAREVS